jgi:hypothetical protein
VSCCAPSRNTFGRDVIDEGVDDYRRGACAPLISYGFRITGAVVAEAGKLIGRGGLGDDFDEAIIFPRGAHAPRVSYCAPSRNTVWAGCHRRGRR